MSSPASKLLFALAALAGVLVTPAHAVKRRAFVTSTTGNGNLSSWAGATGATAHARADAICRARAAAAQPNPLPNAGTYRAWLSTSTTDAYCHVQGLTGKKDQGCDTDDPLPGGGPWYLVNGITNFTAALDELVGTPFEIYRPVMLDENGDEIVEGRVMTGTSQLGKLNFDQDTCLGWTSASAALDHLGGLTNASGGGWTAGRFHGCDDAHHLLCLEPGASEIAKLGWSPGAIVFATSLLGDGELSSWQRADGLTGIAAGDRICRNLASQAHLPSPSSFVAWLSTDAVDAVDRLTTNGPFRRVDAFAIANNLADLVDGVAANSLHVDESGNYLGNGLAWTGTHFDGIQTAATCDDWKATNGFLGQVGHVERARNGRWTSDGSQGCDDHARLYCFSNVITLFWDGFDLTADTSRWTTAQP